MRKKNRMHLLTAVACATLAASSAHSASPEEIAALVNQMGAKESGAREAAEKQLITLGAAARPALLKALDAGDAEIEVRAAQALDQIRAATARTSTLWNETLPPGNFPSAVAAGKVGAHEMAFSITNRVEVSAAITPPPGGAAAPRPAAAWVSGAARAPQSLVCIDGALLVTSRDAHFISLDPTTGMERWNLDTTVGLDGSLAAPGLAGASRGPASVINGLSPPAAADGVAYLGTEHSLLAVDMATGKALWQAPLPAGIIGTPVVFNDRVLAATANGITQFDKKTSRRLDTIGPNLAIYSAPAVLNDHVIAFGTLQGLVAIDITGGRTIWTHDASGMIITTDTGARTQVPRPGGARISAGMARPVLDHGTLYYSSIDTLFALDPATGNERWHWQPTPVPNAPPVPASPAASSVIMRTIPKISAPAFAHEGRWLVVNTTLGVFAIETTRGQLQWEYHVPGALPPISPAATPTLVPPVISGNVVHLIMSQREARPPVGRAALNAPPAAAAVAVNAGVIVNRSVGLALEDPPGPSTSPATQP